MKRYNKGFTLIEVLVGVSILSIIMVSVFASFVAVADINNKTDASRVMQENIKQVVEIISEDIRKNGIDGVSEDIGFSCDSGETTTYTSGDKLCIGNSEYFLAKQNEMTLDWIRDDNCDFGDKCSIILNNGIARTPISNSWITFNDLSFRVSNTNPKRVIISFEAMPALDKGIKPDLIKQNTIRFQTTIGEDIYR